MWGCQYQQRAGSLQAISYSDVFGTFLGITLHKKCCKHVPDHPKASYETRRRGIEKKTNMAKQPRG